MIHHPIVLVPKFIVLGIIMIVLIVLHGILPPDEFRVAVIVCTVGFVVFSLALWAIALKMLSNPDSKLAKASILSHEAGMGEGCTACADEFGDLVGQEGQATSALRPSGTAVVCGRRIPVVTLGDFVASGATIEVVEAQGSKVVVKAVENHGADNETEEEPWVD